MSEERNFPARSSRAALAFKAARRASGFVGCDVCGWLPPAIAGRVFVSVMHAHHVVPIAAGGADHARNLVLLCPNCHAIAHLLLSPRVPRDAAGLPWGGYHTPPQLIDTLKRMLGRSAIDSLVDSYPAKNP